MKKTYEYIETNCIQNKPKDEYDSSIIENWRLHKIYYVDRQNIDHITGAVLLAWRDQVFIWERIKNGI